MLDVECFTQLLYIQRITKDTSILQASLLIPSPSCLVYRGENLPPFYTLRSLQSYIIDLFSLAAFSYKANNFTPSFIARVETADIAGDNVLVDEYALKKKRKRKFFLTLNIRSTQSSFLFSSQKSHLSRNHPFATDFIREKGEAGSFEIEKRERDANTWNT